MIRLRNTLSAYFGSNYDIFAGSANDARLMALGQLECASGGRNRLVKVVIILQGGRGLSVTVIDY